MIRRRAVSKPIRVILLLLASWLVPADGQGGTFVQVPEGDVPALVDAIEAANASGVETFLVLAGKYELGPDDALPTIVGNIWFMGGRLAGVDGGPTRLISVGPEGRLILRTTMIGFSLGEGALIENHGVLVTGDAHFERITGVDGELIGNFGEAQIDETTFLHVGRRSAPGGILTNRDGQARLRNVVVAELPERPSLGGAFANHAGRLRIVNGTLMAGGTVISTEPGARTQLVNTIIANPHRPDAVACSGAVVSFGHNLIWDESCKLDGPEDLQGMITGVLPLQLEGRGPSAGQRPRIELAGASPAVDSGDEFFCDAFRSRLTRDGNNDGVAACDRGAFELRQAPLTDGAIIGVYNVPDGSGAAGATDGHYVSVFDTGPTALVVWNTFDREGNPAWVFGTGELVNGRSLLATAYTNEDGVLTDAGPVGADLANPWGTLLIELDSCNEGRVIFESDRPGFGRGEFTIRRLASTRQLACEE